MTCIKLLRVDYNETIQNYVLYYFLLLLLPFFHSFLSSFTFLEMKRREKNKTTTIKRQELSFGDEERFLRNNLDDF